MNFRPAARSGRLAGAAPLLLLAGGALLLTGSGLARSDTPGEAAVELEPLQVTGTRLRLVDGERTRPLTVIDRETLAAGGEFRLAEALRKLPFNSLGARSQGFGVGGREVLGYVDLRGLGPGRTLVLVNGRRMTLAGQSNGAVANLNHVPMSAVERVEILRDGASAVYGSDAIGGVVNVILRSAADALTIGAGVTDASSGADESELAVSGGRSTERGRWFWSLEANRREGVTTSSLVADSSELVLSVNPTGEPGTWFATDWFGDGSGVPGPWTAETNCPPELRRPFGIWNTIHPATGERAGPLPVSLCALKQSERNQWSPDLDGIRAYASFESEPVGRTEGFARVLASHLEAGSLLTTGGDLPDAFAADNPLNPAFDPAEGRAPWPASAYFGFLQPGDRKRQVTSGFVSVVAGLRSLLDAGELEFGLQFDRENTRQSVGRLALRDELRAAIDSGRFDPFEPVNPEDVVEALLYTQRDRGESKILAADLSWSRDVPVDFAGFEQLSLAAGGELREESFRFEPDPEDEALNVFGWLPGGYRADARRTVHSVYVEAALLRHRGVEFSYAGRYDGYSRPDEGQATSKLGLSWRARAPLLLRAGWGQGFRVPTLVELAAPSVPALAFRVVDTLGCGRVGGNRAFQECRPFSILARATSNPELEPETSTHFNAGLAWQVGDRLKVTLDYWGVTLEDQVAAPSAQQVLDLEALGRLPAGSAVRRNAGGFVEEIVRGRTNFPSTRARGVDLELDASFDFPGGSSLGLYSVWALLTAYEQVLETGAPADDRLRSGSVPGWRSRTGLDWNRGDGSIRLVVHGVDAFEEGRGNRFEAWWSADAQGSWQTPWKGSLAVGVRNLFDRRPDALNRSYHDYDGRTWYVRYRQAFGGRGEPAE